MDVLASPITEVTKCLIVPVVHQIQYLVQYKKNISRLRDQLEVLARTRDDVKRSVEAARKRGELIKEVVQSWLERVDTFQVEASRFLDNEFIDDNNKWCLVGCTSRYRLGKEAKRRVDVVDELRREGEFDVVSEIMPPPSMEFMPTGDFEVFDVTRAAMEKIIEVLKDEKVNSIGVYGMGGVGKTMLMKEVGKRVRKDELFDEVVMATVSQNLDLKRIQGEIAENLGLILQEESENARARRLSARLKQEKRILIILDDLWARLELPEVGIPCGDEHKGCKVVLTTRSLDVCSVMDTQVKVEIQVLSEKDSWHLFRKRAGDIVDSPNLLTVAREVAKECKGLPIAIVTLGRALRDKDPFVWVDAARQLRKSVSTDIEGMNATVFSCIKLSYDYLESRETRLCFLFCCLFPEDYRISTDVLMWYTMGEGLFGDVETLDEARGRVHTICDKLKASSLLLKGEQDGYVVMHDVIRDVAISIASKEENGFMLKAGIGLRQWPEREKLDKCMRLSAMKNEISELPNIPLCPNLLTLLLRSNKALRHIPDSFFDGMKNLTTLDLSYTRISVLPRSFSCLPGLRTLCLEYCDRLTDVTLLGKLKNLEILSLRFSSIQTLPKEIGGLMNLRLLNLSGTDHLNTITPNVISKLSSLQELYMANSFKGWEIEGAGNGSNASLCEVASLTSLTALFLQVENATCFSTHMPNCWENLTRFCISLDDCYWDSKAHRSVCLHTSDPVSNWVKVLLDRTDKLILVCCEGLKNVAQLSAGGFNSVKCLRVQKCDDMEYLLSVEEEIQESAFHGLEKLHLKTMNNLKEICHGPLPTGLFGNLVILKVRECNKLINVLPSCLLLRLRNLEILLADSCCELKDVFHYVGPEEGHDAISKLRELYLFDLPSLTAIWKGIVPLLSLGSLKQIRVDACIRLRYLFSPGMAQRLQHLEKLKIENCDEMVKLISEDEDEQMVSTEGNESPRSRQSRSSNFSGLPPPLVLHNLRKLKLYGCKNLKHLLPMTLAQGLLNLQVLRADNCLEMEVLIAEDREVVDNMLFPRLRTLVLEDLPKLSNLYQGVRLLNWPSLEEFRVGGCPNLRNLPLGPHTAPRLRNILGDEDWFDGLEWNDENVKIHLQLLFIKRRRYTDEELYGEGGLYDRFSTRICCFSDLEQH